MKSATRQLLKKWSSWLIALCIYSSALMTMGCASLTTKSVATPIPANLDAPCAKLDEITGTTGKAWVLWATPTIKSYQDCEDKVEGLRAAWPKK